MGKRIIVAGSSFAAVTAAVELAHLLRDRHELAVISRTKDLVFLPS
jgi:hypothetical protein